MASYDNENNIEYGTGLSSWNRRPRWFNSPNKYFL